MLYLSALERAGGQVPDEFPWTVPLIRDLQRLEFAAPVSFLVGENGCGKSTLLEGIAAGLGAVAAGSQEIEHDSTLQAARALAAGFRFERRRHAKVRLFLRAEDVFGYTQRVQRLQGDLAELRDGFDRSLPAGSYGRTLATGAMSGQLSALSTRYGANPDGRSHGETFLHLLMKRLVPNGLYLLDEPETPLSASRVLSLLALIKDRVQHGCQFVIATHSPILLALPGAEILLLEAGNIRRVAYDDVENVRLTREFLSAPERFLRYL